jgi:hypothetical protein
MNGYKNHFIIDLEIHKKVIALMLKKEHSLKLGAHGSHL